MEFSELALFDAAPIAYSIIDLEGRQLAGNRAYWSLFGYEPDEAADLDVFRLTHPDDLARTSRYLEELSSGQAAAQVVDKRYVRRDGSVFWGRLRATVLEDEDGDPVCLLGVIEDITDRIDALERLRLLAEERSRFVAAVSQEIRNPLHVILGLAELLAAPETGADPELCSALLREADGLRGLVDDILELSELEANRIEPMMEVFSPRELLDDVVDVVGGRIAERGLDFELRLDPATPAWVSGARQRIHQVLVKLVSNAISHTESGSITVSLQPVEGELIRFGVGDTGVGIAAEEHERVFAPFLRLPGHDGGLGVGLTVCRRLVELMGGTIAVESTPGVGSTFVFDLPLRAGAAVPADEGSVDASTATTRPRVLVVEDSPVNQLLARSQLEQLGYDAEVAETGPDALIRFRTGEHAAVLLDWHLPGMDGIETARRIRQVESEHGWSRTPVIAVTARTMAGDREACLAAGMDDFLSKPVSISDLRTTLRRWLAGFASHPSPAEPRADPASETTVDETALRRLGEDLGDPTIIGSLVETFLCELPERRATIRDASSRGDAEHVRQAAHTLKSTSAMVGALPLSDACERLEAVAAGGDGNLATAAAVVDDLAAHTASALPLAVLKIGGHLEP